MNHLDRRTGKSSSMAPIPAEKLHLLAEAEDPYQSDEPTSRRYVTVCRTGNHVFNAALCSVVVLLVLSVVTNVALLMLLSKAPCRDPVPQPDRIGMAGDEHSSFRKITVFLRREHSLSDIISLQQSESNTITHAYGDTTRCTARTIFQRATQTGSIWTLTTPL